MPEDVQRPVGDRLRDKTARLGEALLAFLVLLFLLLLGTCSPVATRHRSPGSVPPGPAQVEPAPISLLGRAPLVLPSGLTIAGLDVGGLSALAYLGEDRYAALVDNQGTKPARIFTLVFRVRPEGPQPLPGQTAAEIPTGVVRLGGFDGKTMDAEGLAATPWGTFLVASELEPSIREFARDGRLLSGLPVPAAFLPGREHGIQPNLGFESLALSADGATLWTGTERALTQDVPETSRTAASPARLLRYRREGSAFVPDGQFVYPIDAIEDPGLGFAVRGLSELLLLPDGRLLALEREFVTGRGSRIQIYALDLAGATDVSALDSIAGHPYKPIAKTLLYDFANAGFLPDNIEGMALGPTLPGGDSTLVLVSDDNFMPLLQQTQLVALRLHTLR